MSFRRLQTQSYQQRPNVYIFRIWNDNDTNNRGLCLMLPKSKWSQPLYCWNVLREPNFANLLFFQFVNVRIVLYSISNNVKFPSLGVSLIDNIIKCPTFPQNHVVASYAVGARRQRLTRVILWHFGSISARCDNNKTFPPRGTYLPNPVLLFFFVGGFCPERGRECLCWCCVRIGKVTESKNSFNFIRRFYRRNNNPEHQRQNEREQKKCSASTESRSSRSEDGALKV